MPSSHTDTSSNVRDALEAESEVDDRRYAALADLFDRLGPDPESNIDTIVGTARDLFDCDLSLYHRIDRQTGDFSVIAARGLPPNYPSQSDPEGQICYEATMEHPDDLTAIESLQETEWGSVYPEYGAYLGTPVSRDGRVVGSLCLMDEQPRAFSEVDRRLFSTLGTAVSLEESRRASDAEITRLNEMLRAIRGVSQLIVRERDRTRIFQSTCDLLVDTSSYGCAFVLARDRDGDFQLEASAPANANVEAFRRQIRLADLVPRLTRAPSDDNRVVSWNPYTDPSNESGDDEGPPVARLVGISLNYRGIVYGILILGSGVSASVPGESSLLRGIGNDLAFLSHMLESEADHDELADQALRDWLTNLPNRTLFRNRLEHAIDRSERRDRSFALLFLDLDKLKDVNDSLGHAAGDQLLIQFAERLRNAVREEDTVARIGGDEFTIILEQLGSEEAIDAVLERLETALERPFEIADECVHASVSIGIARYQQVSEWHERGAITPDEMMRAADQAMYRAKERASTEWSVVQIEDLERHDRIQRSYELHEAVESGQIVPYLHSIVDIGSRGLRGAEVLARWEHPTRGVLSAGEFIAVAERRGFLWELTRAVHERALAWFERASSRLPDDFQLYLNINPSSFDGDKAIRLLEQFDLPPERVVFEITEQALLRHPDRVRRFLDRGCRLAIDDFGTGYSSLEYLRTLEADILKLDLAFVQEAPDNRTDRAIVEMVCGLGDSLDLTVVAEGVETGTQLQTVRSLDCICAQGFYFHRPTSLDDYDIEALDRQCRQKLDVET